MTAGKASEGNPHRVAPSARTRRIVLGTVTGMMIAAVAAASGPLDSLLPRPVKVAAADGTLAYEKARVEVVRADVVGAPPAVREEAYALNVTTSGVTITASDPRGERYARVTLKQLAKLGGGQVPCCRIVDWPVLRWRGYMNDCGRNYLEMPGLKAILDVMAAYKLNLFHWHLTDYHGWRLESKKFPALQDRKAFRRQIGKYYTQDEFREIVDYAAQRGITVMPELDVPGHTLALRRGLGVDTMSAPGVEKAVTELFEELCSLAPAEKMPFIHLGTDEARTREEKCDDAYVTTWAKAVNACGRKAVVWAPGKKTDPSCDVIDMAWYDNHVTNSANPFFYADYTRLYNGSWTPFDVLSLASFVDPRHWKSEAWRQLGAIGCTWHDDNVGEDTCQLFRDCMVFPSLLGFADNYWSGRPADRREYFGRLPPPGNGLHAEARELERIIALHRDTFFGDFRYPFPFVRQTDMRWRITDLATGRPLAKDVPQATVWIVNSRAAKSSFVRDKSGGVLLETWIFSPTARKVGAWIDFSSYYGAYSRMGGRTPEKGEWNRVGAKAYLNGIEIRPPEWKQPGMVSTTPANREQDIPYSTDLLEKPLVDELPTLRPPTPLTLRQGWNYVRLVAPRIGRWGCTFCPVDGTSDHPREVEGLKYSSEPPSVQ